MCQPDILHFTKISYITVFPVVNAISFSLLDQQLLRFSPLSDHVTDIICHLFKSVQFDFEEGNFRSDLIELLPLFASLSF